MAEDITISIDGVEIKTQPGKMVLEAAIDADIFIPYLCYHPGMKPFAACRMCVVAVEGGRGYPASCTLPVQDGMRVRSESKDVNDLRRSVMEMLIAEHPNGCLTCHRIDLCGPNDICLRHVAVNDRCVTCPKNERCEFKDTVRYLTMSLESPLNYAYRQIPLEVRDPFYDRDYNLCITCGRCVRVCDEVRGDDAICFVERSGRALVGTSYGTSLLESGCEFCGACIDVCPVGALVEREHKWEKPRHVERSICPHCPVGCQLNLEINGQGRFIRSVPELNSPANHGQACYKGKFGMEFLNRADRLKAPLVRVEGQLRETTWDEALDYIAARLPDYKGDSFAMLASPDSTNEELYLAQKFARAVMGTNNVDHTANIQPELVLGLQRSLGYAGATNPTWELEQAGCILSFNNNLTEAQNVVGVPIKKAVKRGTRLVVIDTREVELTRYAHSWLRPAPGTELMLLGGILKSVLDQGLERTDWMAEHCDDPATLHYALHSIDLEEVARVTQVSLEAITHAARLFGEAAQAAIVYGLDNIPQELQRDCVPALVDLALLTGNLGKPGGGLYPMVQGTNEQGAWDVGCAPNRLPGCRPWNEEGVRRTIEELWGCTLPDTRGMGVRAALEAALEGRVKAIMLVGDSANLTNGSLGDGLAALDAVEFLVVQDTFLSPAAQVADVVLPRSACTEKDGTLTNLERRIQRVKPFAHLKGGSGKSEGWVIGQVAQRMQASGFDYASTGAVMEEIARISPIYGGVSHQRLEQETSLVLQNNLADPKPTQVLYASKEDRGIQWPCPFKGGPGTPVLYTDGFPAGKADPITPEFRVASAGAESDYPLWFAPGRVLLQPERGTEVVREGKRNRIARDEVIELNPADADQLSIGEGDRVEVRTPRGSLQGPAGFNTAVPQGVVSSTALFGQLAVDLQASELPNPMAYVPRLNVLPATVSKLQVGSPE